MREVRQGEEEQRQRQGPQTSRRGTVPGGDRRGPVLSPHLRRLCLVPALVALAIGAGCGGGGEDSTSTSAAAASAQQQRANARTEARNEAVRREYERRQRAEAPTPEEEEAEQTATGFYEALGEGEAAEGSGGEATVDTDSFCDLMSAAAKAQTVRYAEVSSGMAREWDCEAAVRLLVVRLRKSGEFEGAGGVEVIGVNVRGGEATATVRFGDGPATSLPLVKEGGEWKLAATPTG